MTFLEFAPVLDADPRVLRAQLLLIAHAHQMHRPNTELTFLLMSYRDFLLRLPSALERVLEHERAGRNVSRLQIEIFERCSIEARNLALRFEPWSNSYRLATSALVASGLLEVILKGDEHSWTVVTTDQGHQAAAALSATRAFEPTWRRAEIITKTLEVKTKTLRSFIERSVPETISLEKRSVG